MADLYKYGVAMHLYKPIIKRGVVDFAVGADWTPAAGDVKISKDGGAAANVTNLPTAITMGNTAMWDYSVTATEMQAAKVRITVADTATKAVEDVMFEIDTYGNASAQHAVDLSDAVRAGLTALPNANAEAAGGLLTRGSGAGQINQAANGMVDVNVVRNAGTAITAAAGVQEVKVQSITNGVIAAATFAANALDAVWSTAARILTAGTNIVLGKGTGVTGFNDLDAAGVRGAVGLASANLDTQLAAIAGFIDTEVAAIFSRIGAPAGASIAADIAAIQAKTTNLPASPAAVGSAMTLTSGERTSVADALLDRDMSVGTDSGSPTVRTVRQALRFLRNKWSIAGGTLTVTKEDDTASSWTGTVTQTAGNPVSQIDPS